jgi:hypothetical protein
LSSSRIARRLGLCPIFMGRKVTRFTKAAQSERSRKNYDSGGSGLALEEERY